MQTHLATSWLEVASLVALCSGSVLYRHRLALGRTVMLPSRAILRQCPQVMQTGFSPRRFLVRQLLTVPPTPSRTAACHWSHKSKYEQETLLRMPLTLELLPCAWESSAMHLLHVEKPEQLQPLLLPLPRPWLRLQLQQQRQQLLPLQLERLLLSLLHWLRQPPLQPLQMKGSQVMAWCSRCSMLRLLKMQDLKLADMMEEWLSKLGLPLLDLTACSSA